MGCLKESIKEFVELRKEVLKEAFKERPKKLGIIAVNQNLAGQSYVKSKMSLARELGVETNVVSYETSDIKRVMQTMDEMSNKVDGLILQLPALSPESDKILIDRIKAWQDVDSLSSTVQIMNLNGSNKMQPATARGIADFMDWYAAEKYHIPDIYEGKTALVIGRGKLVGDPISRILRDRFNMTVINAHSHTSTRDLMKLAPLAFVTVAAANKPIGFFEDLTTKGYIQNSLYFDCGLFQTETGQKIGCFYDYQDYVNWTPPIGGVGKLTTISLFANLNDIS